MTHSGKRVTGRFNVQRTLDNTARVPTGASRVSAALTGYVVVELNADNSKPEHLNLLIFYVAAVNDMLRLAGKHARSRSWSACCLDNRQGVSWRLRIGA